MTRPAPFTANAQPLGPGLRLLEASAGTGKTFALAHLALRLVAEEGVDLRELLVVTFTEAAAAELRDRIGRRLQQALEGLEDPGREAPDPVLAEWLDGRRGADDAAGESPQPLRGRLLLALEGLDAADVTTIHGFCARTLRRLPLEAGLAPQLRLEADPLPLVSEVVHDYWQSQVLPLPPALLAGLRRRGVTPAEMIRLLLRLDGDPALGLDPLPAELPVEADLGRRLPDLWLAFWEGFRRQWGRGGAALEQDLRAIAARWRQEGGAGVKTTPYAPRPRTDRSAVLDSWLDRQPAAGDYGAVVEQELLRQYFHPGHFSRLARRVEGGDRPVRLPQEGLMRALADLVDRPAELVLLHGCHWGRAELRRRRRRNGSAGFGQLLELLDPGEGGTAAVPLLEAVAQRYRAALIDEFQDTDPIQWRILRRAFGDPRHQLVVVGDPKQAIYRFRGGDLDTYRRARNAAGSRFELVENRRSTAALVEALNRLMGPAGLARSRLTVPAVVARSARQGPETAPLELLWLGGERAPGTPPPGRTELEARLPGMVAAYLVELLERGLPLGVEQEMRPITAEDVCLLVANHRQAEQLRAALERCGLPTRLVSRQDVFATPAAGALQRLLDALADPADANRLRLLAASPLLGWDARSLATASPSRWSSLAGELDRLARRLPRLGLPMVVAELLGSARLARLALGGRLLADLQQLAELVQEQLHAERLGPAAAADWLRRLRLDENRRDRDPPEEHQIHSDRADGAVSVMTVHASKGLEFPVVICPYLWEAPTPPKPHRPGSRRQPPGGAPRLDLHLDPDWGDGFAAAAEQHGAELAERERLAYVAVTRAQHLLVLAWGPAKGQEASPLFPWLFPDEPLPQPDDRSLAARGDDAWRQLLADGAERRRLGLRILDPPAWPSAAPSAPLRPPSLPLQVGPVPDRRLDDLWGRSSYSSWTRAGGGEGDPAAEEGRDIADREPVADEDVEVPLPPVAEEGMARWPEEGPLGAFPRGPGPGDCLHRILERLDYRQPVQAAAGREIVERELRRAALGPIPVEPVLEGLERVRLTPLGGGLGAFRVADLDTGRRVNEMRFDLTLGLVEAEALAAAFANHPGGDVGADYARSLAALPVASRGFLTGSIDLVFEAPDPAGGRRWWVLDWKSNWLGRRDGDGRPLACGPRHYGPAAMAELMVRNHYVLQAHLYLVALHRYLRWRRPGYRPEDHLGGYAYAFLRGAPGSTAEQALPGAVPGMVVAQPPLERILTLDAALGPC